VATTPNNEFLLVCLCPSACILARDLELDDWGIPRQRSVLTWDIFEIKNVRKINQQFVIKYILVEALYVPVRNFNSISVKLSSMNSSPVSGNLTTSISSGSVDHPEGPEITDEKDISLIAKRQG
jgi:hypothetical protein